MPKLQLSLMTYMTLGHHLCLKSTLIQAKNTADTNRFMPLWEYSAKLVGVKERAATYSAALGAIFRRLVFNEFYHFEH